VWRAGQDVCFCGNFDPVEVLMQGSPEEGRGEGRDSR
jgi:hypothetical protein